MNLKKHILFLLLLSSISYLKSQSEKSYHHCLFPESSFAIGGSAIYGIDFKGAGANARLYYNMSEQFCFGPEFSFLTTSEKELYDINLIAHYIIDVKKIGLYPVGGINYTIENETNISHGEETTKAIGIVAGTGIHRNLNRITVFTEYTHHFVKIHDDADFLNLGILFMINTNPNN